MSFGGSCYFFEDSMKVNWNEAKVKKIIIKKNSHQRRCPDSKVNNTCADPVSFVGGGGVQLNSNRREEGGHKYH